MKRGFSTAIPAAAAAAFVFGSALESPAQEKNASDTSVTSSSQPNAIAGAKKDFESIKSSRDAALQPKGEMPRVSMPDWQGASPPSPGAGVQPKTTVRETKSANWLVDAMEKQSGSSSVRGQRDPEREREQVRDRDRDSGWLVRGHALETRNASDERRLPESRDEKDPKDTIGAVNPLARYLGDWMTPQDYALLKPGLADSLLSGAFAKGPAALPAVGSVGSLVSLPANDLTSASLAQVKPVFAPPVARENPYLQSLERQESSGQIFTPQPKLPAVAPAPATPSPLFVPPPPVTPPQSKIPEFAKPATDEKYFKPLKRF